MDILKLKGFHSFLCFFIKTLELRIFHYKLLFSIRCDSLKRTKNFP